MIVLVEDDKDVRDVMGMVLDMIGVEHTDFANVAEAVKYINENEPTILLTDLRLNHGGPALLIETCRKRYPKCKSVLVTATTKVMAEAAQREMNIDHVLLKPFSVEELEKLLKSLT